MEDPITLAALFLRVTVKQLRLSRQKRTVKRTNNLTEFHLLEGVQIRKFHRQARTGQFHSLPRNEQKVGGLIIVLAVAQVNTTSKPLVVMQCNKRETFYACSPFVTCAFTLVGDE